MPVIRIFSAVRDKRDKDQLQKIAKINNMSEYKVIQEAVLNYIWDPERSEKKSLLRKLLELVQSLP